MEEKVINYSNLSNRIVQQIFDSTPLILNEDDKKRIFEDKLERAKYYSQIAKQFNFLD